MMSLAYCNECERIVEGNTRHGVEITINLRKGTQEKHHYERCKICDKKTTELQEDDPRKER